MIKKLALILIMGLLLGCTSSNQEVIHAKEFGQFHLTCLDRAGNVLWQDVVNNALADEGEQYFLGTALADTSQPANFYIRLYNDTPAETDTLGDLTGEPSTYGYAAQAIPSTTTGWAIALVSGDYKATSTEETFVASGGSWGPVTYAVLATSSDNSGKLIAYGALSVSRTLASGDSLLVVYTVTLQ
jgi:hypothetical protein